MCEDKTIFSTFLNSKIFYGKNLLCIVNYLLNNLYFVNNKQVYWKFRSDHCSDH